MREYTLASVRAEIRWNWSDIVRTARVDLAALEALPAVPSLLGSSTKVKAGEGLGILTAVAYLAPAREAGGPTTCANSTKACRALCLGHSAGRMVMTPCRKARLWKTALYFGDRGLFVILATLEAKALESKARKLGMIAAVRIDGSSDTGIGAMLAKAVPGVQFYDYTKDAGRARYHRACGPSNYDVTLSYSGRNLTDCILYALEGGRVAVVFDTPKGEALPAEWLYFPVIDGDTTDARFLDPGGVVVGLRFKATAGRARKAQLGVARGFVARG